MKEVHKIFITYVRTIQFWQQRLRGKENIEHVYISQAEIEKRFFPFPSYDLKKEIQYLIENEELEIIKKATSKGHEAFFYRALKSGGINPALLEPKGKELDDVHKQMLIYLKDVTLKANAPSTLYFDVFLKFVKINPRIFFTVDTFSNRVHTPITNFHREYRPAILLKGENTTSLDVVTMQPLLLGKILKKEIGENEYSSWINSGKDIYIIMQEKANLSTRDEAKKKFFEILFSPANNQLVQMFGSSNWINWINELKQKPMLSNPHTTEKEYSNLAWLLQTTEVNVMYKVWTELIKNSIPFLSVHDEIIIRENDYTKADKIFRDILTNEFDYFKLCSKGLNLKELIKIQWQKLTPECWIFNFEKHKDLTNYNLQVLCEEINIKYKIDVTPENYYNTLKTLN
ncbi:MAG: hypothetical protein WCO13_05660 [Bacteroidota bacterium]